MINLRIFHFGIWDAKKPQNMSNNDAISSYRSPNLKDCSEVISADPPI